MNKNKKSSVGKVLGAEVGMVAIGTGAYYLFGPKAKTHQKKAKMLLTKMEKEVKSEIKKVKEITPPLYHKVVDIVSKNYAKQYKIHEKDIKTFAKKMKAEWKGADKIVKKTIKTLKKKSK